MPIKYALYPNEMTSDPNDQMAQVQQENAYTLDDLIDIMTREGSTVTQVEASSVLEQFFKALLEAIKSGRPIVTSMFTISVSIRGVFVNIQDRFDNKRHHARLNISPGPRFRDVLKELTFTKVTANKPLPTLLTFKDVSSASSNDTLTSGGVGELLGSRLKINTDDADEGIYFIAEDGTETKVTTFIRNKPSELIFMIPANLNAGNYQAVVRAKLGSKTLKEGVLTHELVVT